MKTKNIVLVAAVLILVGITAAGTYVSVQNYKKAENVLLEQSEENSETKENMLSKYNKESENTDPEKQDSEKVSETKAETEEKKVPTFLYFVSENDTDYEKALEVFEELKKEYGEKVDFQLKNVTKEPELLENFSLVKDNTPALIADGEDLGIQLKTVDKNILVKEIEKMLK